MRTAANRPPMSGGRVVVVGGGFYGSSLAAHLAREGAQVTLLEARADLLGGASYFNQARVHGGYHYPRSLRTAGRSQASYVDFMARYMVRNEHEDAPVLGPEVDQYEDHDTKMERMIATAAINKLVQSGVLSDVETAGKVPVGNLKEALANAYLTQPS